MRRQLLVLAGLLGLTALVYAHGLDGEFQFDDLHTVELNQSIRHFDDALRNVTLTRVLLGKRVLTDVTFAVNASLFGPAPLSFHATNLAIHLGAVLLAYFLARRVLALCGRGGREGVALTVAALFALHPVQTQAVAYVSQRGESLASLLALASLLLLLRSEAGGTRRAAAGQYALAFVCFALALAAKTVVYAVPVVYLLQGTLPGPEQRAALAPWRRRLARAAPFFGYSVLTGALALWALPGEHAGFAIASLPPWRYFLTQWHVVATYLRLLFWPAGLNVDWDFPLAGGLGDPAVLASGVLLALLLAVAVVVWRRCRTRTDPAGSAGRAAAFGVVWFFLWLAPTSTFVPLADVLMEHRLYLAGWGIFLSAVVVVDSLSERLSWSGRRPLAIAALALVCLLCATATYRRVELWRTKLALWSDAVAKSPRKARAHLGLGNAYRRAGQLQSAIAEYRQALALASGEAPWLRTQIRGRLSSALLAKGDSAEAVPVLRAGLAEEPDETGLLGLLAMASLETRDLSAANAAAERLAATAGRYSASFRVLAMVKTAMGERAQALAALERAVRLEPEESQGRVLLARAYRGEGRFAEACAVVQPVLEAVLAKSPQLVKELGGCRRP